MIEPLRICLFDAEQLPEVRFRTPFEHLKNVTLAGETTTWDELKEWLRLNRVDVVAVNLGEQKEQGLAIVQRITEVAPNASILGVSRRTDPQTIIAAMRTGCGQFVNWPIDVNDLTEAIERIRSSRVQTIQTSRRVCIVGSAGGSGATTLACNLAIELGQLSDKFCSLVDLNLEFGDVCSSFDAHPPYSLADVCRQGVEVDRVLLTKAMQELPCKVSILGAPKAIEETHEIVPEAISTMFKVMSGMFPYVVVDLPRYYAYLSCAALDEADYILIVTQLGVPFIRNATRIFGSLKSMGLSEHKIQVVLNRCNSAMDKITPEDVAEHFGKPIFAMVPNDYKRVQSSLDLGHPIVADAPSSPARVAIQKLARQIAGIEEEDGAGDGKGKAGSILGKLWNRGTKVKA